MAENFFTKKLTKYKISILKAFYIFSGSYLKTIVFRDKIILDLDLREKIDRQIFFRNSYENELIDKTINLIKTNNIQFFFDVGCNLGIYSLLVSKNIPNIETYSYDILEKNIIRLNEMIKKNNLSNIKTFQFGLSDKIETLDAFSDSPGSSVFRLEKLPGKNYQVKQKVSLKRLDDLFPQLKGKKVLFKVDIENHEPFFLKGAENFLKNNNIILQIEMNDEVSADIDNILKNKNFKIISNQDWKWDKYYCNFNIKF